MNFFKMMICAAFISPTACFALGHDTGNGGGAWVCREADDRIRWIKQTDLYEASWNLGLRIQQYTGGYESIVDQVNLRIKEADPAFHKLLQPYLSHVNYLKLTPDRIIYVSKPLDHILDGFYWSAPDEALCLNGKLFSLSKTWRIVPFEQVVIYHQDGTISIQSDLWRHLSEVEKAALVLHESVYALRRNFFHDEDSVATRTIVGWVFSTISDRELGSILPYYSLTTYDPKRRRLPVIYR